MLRILSSVAYYANDTDTRNVYTWTSVVLIILV